MDYLYLKWIHILSSTILFGTGIGSAFFMFMANRRRNVPEIYIVVRHVVMADWVFTTPAIIIQLLSGIALVIMGGYAVSELWITMAIGLFIIVGACWIPVVWIQIKMRDMAKAAVENGTSLPDAYWTFDRWWICLGTLAFPAVIIIFYLMVLKPVTF